MFRGRCAMLTAISNAYDRVPPIAAIGAVGHLRRAALLAFPILRRQAFTKMRQNLAGMIYQDPSDGQYYATPPEQGGLEGDKAWPLHYPEGTKLVGDYHTHGNYMNGDYCLTSKSNDTFNADHFSKPDLSWDPPFRPWTRYLGTPSGQYFQYTPGWFSMPGPIK